MPLREAWERWAPIAADRLDQGLGQLPPEWEERVRLLLAGTGRPLGRRVSLASIGLLAGLLVLLRRGRRPGDLVVWLEYPAELSGTFCVRLGTRSGHARRSHAGARSALEGKAATRSEHYLVARETQFRGVRPRRYWVVVEGVLQAPDSQAVLKEIFEVQAVQVSRGQTVRLAFDLRPSGCAVEVRVLWDRQPAREASVVRLGRPDTLRFARAGVARMELPLGRHRIGVGSGDRVAEREVELKSVAPVVVEIDLGGSENVVFKGCPQAVRPYLQGDLAAAARALEREGLTKLAHLLQARLHAESGHAVRAAEHLESAGRPREAADLRASISDFGGAAGLYVAAGDARRAADMYRRAGNLRQAGEAFEAAGDSDRALECYREAGASEQELELLERCGQPFQAAQIAVDRENRSRAIRLLQQVARDDTHYADACEMLADAFEQESHFDLAAAKLEAAVTARGPDVTAPEMFERWADLLERADDPTQALEVLERLRESEPTYPNIATRIEKLRKQLSHDRRMGADQATAPRIGTAAEPPGSRYEILEQIGSGGMGVVFKARDRRLGREVALKRLPESLRDHPGVIQLFLREARSAAALNHPNIVTLFDADQEGDTLFITMELLEGETLSSILRREGPYRPRDAAALGLQIAAGLQYAHARRIVHRDIKPANLFYTRDRVVKIMDFGLAKMVEEARRSTTVLGGTPYYMAPEQTAGEAVDARTDLYAFGVTLYELATGCVPFRDGDVAYHHRHTAPPDPRSVDDSLPAPLAELILHLLAKDPADRCASAADAAAQLQAVT